MVYMDKELEIRIVLNNLLNGIDYESGAFSFSDKVDHSLKVINSSLNCNDKTILFNDPENSNREELTEPLNELKTLIYTSLNLQEILSYGNEHLPHLEISVTNSNDSSGTDKRLLLDDLSKKFNAIKIFYEELEDIKYMEYKEEFEESIGKFYEILETLDELEITKVVQKEIRELVIKKDSSISSFTAKQEKSVTDGINALNENRPICNMCQNKMNVCKGESVYFWGCSIFPKCYGRRWFTKEEKQMVGQG